MTDVSPEEHYRALTDALSRLDDATVPIDEEDEESCLRRIQEAVRAASAALSKHQVIAEDEGGFLPRATGRKPALIPAGERLKQQHADMVHRAAEIDREIDLQFAFEDFDVELMRLEAAVLRDMLQAHLRRASSVLYEAYIRIEGGEGG